MDIPAFRSAFPEFSDDTKYPDAMIQLWSDHATCLIVSDRWGCALQMGVFLMTAHFIVIAAGNAKAGEAGATPGGGGAITSKSVGSASVSYDTSNSLEEGGGHWNQTIYGRQFLNMARLIGAGCNQL